MPAPDGPNTTPHSRPSASATSSVSPGWTRRTTRTSSAGRPSLNAPAPAPGSVRWTSQSAAIETQRDPERQPAGPGRVVGLHGVVDRQRGGLGQAGDVAGDHHRRAEVAQGAGEGQHRAAASPRQASGSVTARKTDASRRPSSRAASSSAGSTPSNAPRAGSRNSGNAATADATTAPDQWKTSVTPSVCSSQ